MPLLVNAGSPNLLTLVDADALLVVDDDLRITLSQQSALQFKSDPAAGPQSLISLFQADMFAIKSERGDRLAPRGMPTRSPPRRCHDRPRAFEALTRGLAPVIRNAIAQALALEARLMALEANGHRAPAAVSNVRWCGVWTEKRGAVEEGALVTVGGSLWLARTTTTARPGSSRDWVLVVKGNRPRRDEDA